MVDCHSDNDLRMDHDGEGNTAPTPTDHNNLIVNYLPDTMTQTDLQKMFESFGEIESCKVIMNKARHHIIFNFLIVQEIVFLFSKLWFFNFFFSFSCLIVLGLRSLNGLWIR